MIESAKFQSLIAKFVNWPDYKNEIFYNDTDNYEHEAQSSANYCKHMIADIGIAGPIELMDIPYHFSFDDFCGGRTVKSFGRDKMIKRLCNPKVWQKKIRKLALQNSELFHYRVKDVRNGAQEYCSNFIFEVRQAELRRQQLFSDTFEFHNAETGAVASIPGIKEKRYNRMSQKYCQAKGIERLAKQRNLDFAFLSCTTPPRFHANPKNNNNSWDGSTPVDAAKWFSVRFIKVRAHIAWEFKNEKPFIPYIWAKEPHCDGTTHMHILFYAAPEIIERVLDIYRIYFCNDDDFNGNASSAMDIVRDDGRAAPTTYIMQDIMKGAGVGDYKGTKAENIDRIDSWSSTWGIRKFSIGGIKSSISIWEEVRRAHNCAIALPSSMLAIQKAAVASDFPRFIDLIIDSEGNKRIQTIKKEGLNQYNETTEIVIGLVDVETGEAAITRFGKYVRREKSDLLTVKDSYPRYGAASDPPLAKSA